TTSLVSGTSAVLPGEDSCTLGLPRDKRSCHCLLAYSGMLADQSGESDTGVSACFCSVAEALCVASLAMAYSKLSWATSRRFLKLSLNSRSLSGSRIVDSRSAISFRRLDEPR